MSAIFYKFLHISAVMALFLSIGATMAHIAGGGNKESFTSRKFVGMIHGLALLAILVAGFGMMAKYKYTLSQPWLMAKFVAWFLFGMVNMFFYKFPQKAKYVGFAYIVLGTLISYLVFYKPGM